MTCSLKVGAWQTKASTPKADAKVNLMDTLAASAIVFLGLAGLCWSAYYVSFLLEHRRDQKALERSKEQNPDT